MKKLVLLASALIVILTACAPQATPAPEAQSAPDFTLPNALGGDVSLSDYKGQPVFLFFHMAVG